MKASSVLALGLPVLTYGRLEFAGHRGGMSGHESFVPEHSKAAYALGASYGATFIEPDVISTKDGILMVMHGNELGRTSDISERPEFADRETTKTIDDGDGSGSSTITGWFSEDFTWEEISTLRLRSTLYDGKGPLDNIYGFLKFEEMMAYVSELSDMVGTTTFGVYPETKLSNYFASVGLPLEDKFMQAIANAGYCGYGAGSSFCRASLAAEGLGPIVLQSFCPESLVLLKNMTDLPTVSLINGGDDGIAKLSKDGETVDADLVALIATYADILALPTSFDEDFFADAVTAAQTTGMVVHAWVADDDAGLYSRLTDLGVEATFTNNMAYGKGALDMMELMEGQQAKGRSSV
eukprot:CAMPEP_0182563310 /NCGR_PEP_ID=MMETSP1324-20130603/5479_1 /TAXON_ID=236786 /ORGANISM="Florenciella sp., Strain RCC1587" /LENGTH=351 /DNA_ID=CAMNT_0024776475 /DNA_START=42 /DNA_END=1097 /DNA_ORIENTATION=+